MSGCAVAGCAVNIFRFFLVYFWERFANETCTILSKDKAEYGPGMLYKTILPPSERATAFLKGKVTG